MSTDAEPLLKEQMEELQKWFDRLYEKRKAKLKIYHKYNTLKGREEYILDLFFDSTSRSLAFSVPKDALELLDVRQRIRDRWVGEMQQKIMATVG